MKRFIVTLAVATAGALSTPAAAQDEARVNQLIIYGKDECPQSAEDEITVCARLDESERYRIPPDLRTSDDPANQPWSARVKSFEAVGAFGPLSCTPTGLGGELGCTAKMIEAAYQERRTSSDVRAGELIAAARSERLETIDAEAADTQARVEELERQYMDRVRAEDAGEVAPRTADPNVPVVVNPSDIRPAP